MNRLSKKKAAFYAAFSEIFCNFAPQSTTLKKSGAYYLIKL